MTLEVPDVDISGRRVACSHEGCGQATRIHVTELVNQSHPREKKQTDWCLDHVPERFSVGVEDMRALDKFNAQVEAWLAERKGQNKSLPSCTMLSSMAYNAGVAHRDGHLDILEAAVRAHREWSEACNHLNDADLALYAVLDKLPKRLKKAGPAPGRDITHLKFHEA